MAVAERRPPHIGVGESHALALGSESTARRKAYVAPRRLSHATMMSVPRLIDDD
jgi:hypothetical protein